MPGVSRTAAAFERSNPSKVSLAVSLASSAATCVPSVSFGTRSAASSGPHASNHGSFSSEACANTGEVEACFVASVETTFVETHASSGHCSSSSSSFPAKNYGRPLLAPTFLQGLLRNGDVHVPNCTSRRNRHRPPSTLSDLPGASARRLDTNPESRCTSLPSDLYDEGFLPTSEIVLPDTKDMSFALLGVDAAFSERAADNRIESPTRLRDVRVTVSTHTATDLFPFISAEICPRVDLWSLSTNRTFHNFRRFHITPEHGRYFSTESIFPNNVETSGSACSNIPDASEPSLHGWIFYLYHNTTYDALRYERPRRTDATHTQLHAETFSLGDISSLRA